jgi:transposase-like protein
MESAIRIYAWNLRYARALVADLSPAQWTEAGGPGLENHPAWTIGHLVTGSDILAEDLGLERDLPEGWRELFERRGPGDPRLPDPEREAYPPMEALLAELERQHGRVERAWRQKLEEGSADGGELERPLEWRFGDALPTLGDTVVFLAVSHEAMHLGQLAAWRRARGLPSGLNVL